MNPGALPPRPSATSDASKKVEIWGGIECTVNRVGERFYDQLALSGHTKRIEGDLEQFASLGIRTLRYPVLWERVAPNSLADLDWSESDRALSKMRELDIKPIIGLVHHGSGPNYTSLLDDEFSSKLSEFASAVARRYPWIELYTPINEPLTTARFATLYGHWYPHARDDRSFARAVVNQCAGVRAAMSAIRSVNSQARLVQTEDLGKTYSTPALSYQANFDNSRRWLTFDILTGRLDDRQPLWWHLLESGVQRQELESFLSRPCVPDIIGINHYVTSDRFLDDRIDLYPERDHPGNGRQAYVDVEAVRILGEGITGHSGPLREAWDRYALPLAITEVHLGCTREDQLRWLAEAWGAAHDLRSENIDVRAITVWSLLGCYGWCSLLTSDFDSYEPAAFDLRSLRPRPTALARMTAALATTGKSDHPVLDGIGWWRRDIRLLNRPKLEVSNAERRQNKDALACERVILVTGCNGTLGRAFLRVAGGRGLAAIGAGREELDISARKSVSDFLDRVRPWAVVNAAGYVRVDEAEQDAGNCFRINTQGGCVLADECARLGIPLVAISSDLIFDGRKGEPYVESDVASPLNIYGVSKARLEEHLRQLPNALLIRTSAFFGPWDSHNFLATTFHELSQGREVRVANDTMVSPTYVPDLVNTTLDLLVDDERGVWHLVNDGALTWFDFARLAVERAGLDSSRIVGVPMSDLGLRARRPLNSALTSERGKLMPTLETAVDSWLASVSKRHINPEVLETSGV
jgi:dTDP-4-dehydrorhamnose reductase